MSLLDLFGKDANFFTGQTPEQRARGAGQIAYESIPGVSEAVTYRDIKAELGKENPNWWTIGLLGGAGILGIIPLVGDAAGSAIRQGVRARNAVKPSSGVLDEFAKDNFGNKLGINVRSDSKEGLSYSDLILDGKKAYETRDSDSLRKYVGKRVGIVKTGEGDASALGSVIIGEPEIVGVDQFRKLEKEHLVPEGSDFDIKEKKYLYPLINPQRFDAPMQVGKGIVSRKMLTTSQKQSQDILDLLKSGKADQVTDQMLANADQAYLFDNYDLPMDVKSRMARAKEMGFDTDTKQFHGTSSDEFPSFEKDRIGSASDEGFYGKGFYFVPYKGEASYYGKNVGEYFLPKSKDILNLSNETNDFTFYPIEYFKQWNQKFEDLGVLDETQKKSFQAVKKLDNYVNKNVKYLPLRHSDGTEGIIAKVDFPNKYDPEYPREITSTLSAYDSRNMPKTEEEALSDLKRQVIHETSFNSELKKQFEGIGDTTWSISDYIRSDWKIPEKLSEKVAEKGYKGINVGDETVIFEPENIRKTDARFDPRLKHLKNLSAGLVPIGLLPFLMGDSEGAQ